MHCLGKIAHKKTERLLPTLQVILGMVPFFVEMHVKAMHDIHKRLQHSAR